METQHEKILKLKIETLKDQIFRLKDQIAEKDEIIKVVSKANRDIWFTFRDRTPDEKDKRIKELEEEIRKIEAKVSKELWMKFQHGDSDSE